MDVEFSILDIIYLLTSEYIFPILPLLCVLSAYPRIPARVSAFIQAIVLGILLSHAIYAIFLVFGRSYGGNFLQAYVSSPSMLGTWFVFCLSLAIRYINRRLKEKPLLLIKAFVWIALAILIIPAVYVPYGAYSRFIFDYRDSETISDILSIETKINAFADANGILPSSLAQFGIADWAVQHHYEYYRVGASGYKICGNFLLSRNEGLVLPPNDDYPDIGNNVLIYKPGKNCFTGHNKKLYQKEKSPK